MALTSVYNKTNNVHYTGQYITNKIHEDKHKENEKNIKNNIRDAKREP